jgi:hypothetical protein
MAIATLLYGCGNSAIKEYYERTDEAEMTLCGFFRENII